MEIKQRKGGDHSELKLEEIMHKGAKKESVDTFIACSKQGRKGKFSGFQRDVESKQE